MTIVIRYFRQATLTFMMTVGLVLVDALAPHAVGAGQEPARHEVRTTKFTIDDVDTTTPFYLDLLGMTEVGRFVDEGRVTEPFMGFGEGGRVGLLSYRAKEMVEKSTYPVTVLYVPDLDPVATRFKDAKYPIQLLSGPTSGARIAMATDPSGNTVEVVERPGAAAVGGAKLIVDDRAKAEAFFVRVFDATPGRRYQTETYDEVIMEFGGGMFVALFEPKGEPRRPKSEHPAVAIYTRDIDGVFARVKAEGHGYTERGRIVFAQDPAGNVVEIVPMPAQSADATMSMRTPDGQPDVSGTFTFRTLTPLERPEEFAGKEQLSVEDAAAFEAAERTRRNRDLFDPEKGALFYAPRAEGGVLSYNEFWYERGVELTSDKRTSLIVDPPNGRRPPRTEASRVAARERSADQREHMYDSYENRSSGDRCLMGFNAGPPMVSATYNNNVMIFQAPGYVAILNEMVHNARIIPISDTSTEKPPFSQYSGVSRGHWEGETLVIETAQFQGGSSGLTSTNMEVVERLTRIDPDTVAYEFTVNDPTVFTAPYTAMMPFRRTDGPLFEYACHEGNIGLAGILSGARNLEKQGVELRP